MDDSKQAYAFIADRSPQAADRLARAIELTVDLIAEFPEVGRVREDVDGLVRSLRVNGFKHIVFYDLKDNVVTLLRLIHGARELADQTLRE